MVKKVTLEYVLCAFGGLLGLHKFYNRDFKKGFLYLFTLGLFGIGWIRDLIVLYQGLPMRELTDAEIMFNERRSERKQANKELTRTQQLKKDKIPYCPKCKSTSLQYVERRKQLSIGRGVTGSVIGGIVGAPLAGAVGAVTSKKYKGRIKCLNCGKSWKK